MKIIHVVGARPNFMKAAPVYKALQSKRIIRQTIVHTGQHYDRNMSDVFFRDLEMPSPDINLQVGSASHAQQTAAIMERLEPIVIDHKPDMVLVYGDVNSTAAATFVCAKLLVPVGHIEAGLRSFDRTMPEEINRIVTDSLADVLFTPSEDGNENLAREGIPAGKIHFVGNVMIDSLLRLLPASQLRYQNVIQQFDLREYGLVTLHRPSNVDNDGVLFRISETLREISFDIPLIFPVHPRTKQRLSECRTFSARHMHMIDPLGYLDFLALEHRARFVITDSGGVQEETTCLGVPCITVRENTERPVTVSKGTNVLIGRNMDLLRRQVHTILAGRVKKGKLPALWDGHSGSRICEIIVSDIWRRDSTPGKVVPMAR